MSERGKKAKKGLRVDLKGFVTVDVSPGGTPVESRRFSSGGIAQLARAVALQAIGLGFESPYLQ
jgi:hypothetical protein